MSTNREAIIEVDGLVTRIGDKTIHDGLKSVHSTRRDPGIVGGSGSGKTLLLRTIIMLRQPTAGTIRLFGTATDTLDGEATAHIRRRFAMMFQHGALFSSLSVLDNVTMPIREQTAVDAQTIEDLGRLKIRFVGLPDDAAEKLPAELSGGMLKRAAVARALALDPEVLFSGRTDRGVGPGRGERVG